MILQLAKQNQQQTITGAIDRVVSPGWYLVIDAQKHTHRATSSTMYRKGDQVRVIGDQIIGIAGKVKTPSVYEV